MRAVQGDGVVAVLADVQTEKHLVAAVHRIASRDVTCQLDLSGIDCRPSRYEVDRRPTRPCCADPATIGSRLNALQGYLACRCPPGLH